MLIVFSKVIFFQVTKKLQMPTPVKMDVMYEKKTRFYTLKFT